MTQETNNNLPGMVDAPGEGIFFCGTYPKQIDQKSRVPIPKEFRELLGEGVERVVVSRPFGQKKFLEVWPEVVWKRRMLQSRTLHGAEDFEKVMRGYVSQSDTCNLDGQGRLVIPPFYRQKAKLEGDLLWIGVGEKMELWSQVEFEAWEDSIRDDAYEVYRQNQDKFRL